MKNSKMEQKQLLSKYKPKTKNWNLPINEKKDLIISRIQKGPYIEHDRDD